MNKKFLSAILFGALMVTATGTFVSCKDYDDDIDRIDNTLKDLKSQIDALQTEVNNGNWVTNLVPTEGGFTVSFKDGKTYTIVNGKDGEKGDKGENGKDGKGTEVAVKDGYWYIDGEKTDYVAVKKEQLGGNVKVPTVSEDGFWVFYDAEGKPQKSEYKAHGAAYAVEANGAYTLYIPDAAGEMQTIELPTVASMISEIEILTSDFQNETTQEINLSYWLATKTTKWEGPKGNIKDKSVLYGSSNQIYTRIAPVTVDATELEFELVDSKGGVAPISLAAPVSYDKYITRAASGNGLYTIGVESKAYIYSKTNAADFTDQFLSSGYTKGYALKPTTTNYTSLYNVKVSASKETTASLGQVLIQDNGSNSLYWVALGSTNVRINEKQGIENKVTVQNPENLYDLYLSVSKSDGDLFGVKFSDDLRSFTVTKTPDTITDASFTLIIHTLSNIGGDADIKTTEVEVYVNRTMGEATYEKQTKALTATTDKFNVSADALITALGSDLNAWYASVNTIPSVALYNDADCTESAAEGTVTVSMLKNDKDAVSKAEELKNLKFAIDVTGATPLKIGKTYYAKVSFKDKNTSTELNSVVIPFVLTKPELTSILVKENGVFLNGGNVAAAYMYAADAKWDASAVTSGVYNSRYYIDRAFTDMDAKLTKYRITDATFAAANGKVAYDKTTTDLATISSATVNTTKRHYVELKDVDVNGDGVSMDGYKQNLNVKFTGHFLNVQDDSYKYEATYQFCVMSPIKEGLLIADGSIVKVSATGKTQITAANVWAKTYNGEVTYGIFRTTEKTSSAPVTYSAAWTRPDIKSVTFSSSNKNIFEMVTSAPTDPEFKTDGTITKASYIEVEGVTAGKAKLNADILDIWGYSLKDAVDIEATVTPNK